MVGMLHSMALVGQAPKVFSYVSPHGVPVNAMVVTALIGGCALSTCGSCARTTRSTTGSSPGAGARAEPESTPDIIFSVEA